MPKTITLDIDDARKLVDAYAVAQAIYRELDADHTADNYRWTAARERVNGLETLLAKLIAGSTATITEPDARSLRIFEPAEAEAEAFAMC